jgi:antitoxin component YwqK of YwqJK toxin-antitoxin module
VQFYYPSGKLKLWFKLVDGLKEGVSETYYPNGKIQSKVNFLYGKLNGPALNWDIDGNLESTANYVLDKPEGFINYYNKGKISALDYFEDGKNQNNYRELYSNGKNVSYNS